MRNSSHFRAGYASDFVDDPSKVCATAVELGLRTLTLPLDVDGSLRIRCDRP